MAIFTINSAALAVSNSYLFEYDVPSTTSNRVVTFSFSSNDSGVLPIEGVWGDSFSQVINNTPILFVRNFANNTSGTFTVTPNAPKTLDSITSISFVYSSFNTNRFSQLNNVENVLLSKSSVQGDINNISKSILNFDTGSASDVNAISGNIIDLPPTIEHFKIYGTNTLTGNYNSIPSSIISFVVLGNANLSGNTNSLKEGLLEFRVDNVQFNAPFTLNTISGNISDIPSTVTDFRVSNNSLIGDVNDFSNNIEEVHINYNTYNSTGFQKDLRANEMGNDIGGLISDIPNNITVFQIDGNNTISGLIENIITSATDYTLILMGNNTVSGNIGGISGVRPTILLGGSVTTNQFTYTSRNWGNYSRFRLEIINSNLSTNDVDQMLIDMNNTFTNVNANTLVIRLTGLGGFRTNASQTAFNNLVSQGANLFITLT